MAASRWPGGAGAARGGRVVPTCLSALLLVAGLTGCSRGGSGVVTDGQQNGAKAAPSARGADQPSDATRTVARPPTLPGTLYFTTGGTAVPGIVQVVGNSVRPLPPLPLNSVGVRVAPNGQDAAYVDDTGVLFLARLGGQMRRIGAVPGPPDLDWSPDSRWLVYARSTKASSAITLVNVRTGAAHDLVTGRVPVGRPAWSPDGQWIAYAVGAAGNAFAGIAVTHPDGTGRRTVPLALPAGQQLWSVESVSPGARTVFVQTQCTSCTRTLPGRTFQGQYLVDTVTGKAKTLAVNGRVADMVLWTAEGRMLARVVAAAATADLESGYTDVLLDPDGTVVAAVPEPPTLHGALTTFVPD